MTATAPEGLTYNTAKGRWVIAAAVLGSGIASLDATVVNIALPAIKRSFGTGVGTLQWVVTGYSLTLAAFLLIGGTLGDRLGRRRTFSIGVVWFAAASAICGVAPDATVLIVARALQGVGGALLTPASLALLQASFAPEDRSRAIGAWSGLGGLASAAGPLLGGELISAASWRWVFFINLPIAAAVLFITARHVPESHDPSATGRLDGVGAGLAVVVLAGLTYGLIEAPDLGWTSPAVIIALALAVVGGPAFVALEQRREHPMLPVSMFKEHQFAAANAVTFVVYAALGGTLFLLPVELQVVDHYSPLEAGVSLLPVTILMLIFSARSAKLASRIGPRLQMSVGPLVVGAGLLLLTRTTHGSFYPSDVFPAVVTFGAGLAITVAPLTSTALGAAPPEHAGVASAINNVVARAAGLVAVAVLPLLASITGAHALAARSLAHGFRTAMVITGGLCVAGGLLAVALVRNPPDAARLRRGRDRTPCIHCALDASPLSVDRSS